MKGSITMPRTTSIDTKLCTIIDRSTDYHYTKTHTLPRRTSTSRRGKKRVFFSPFFLAINVPFRPSIGSILDFSTPSRCCSGSTYPKTTPRSPSSPSYRLQTGPFSLLSLPFLFLLPSSATFPLTNPI